MNYSWLEFFKYIIAFFFNRKKKQDQKENEQIDKSISKVRKKWAQIEKNKKKAKSNDLENDLNNMF